MQWLRFLKTIILRYNEVMAKEEFVLKSEFDGIELGASLRAPASPVGVLQLVHGMAEHRERYHEFMDYCAEQGLVVAIHDHRGHGASAQVADNYGYFGKSGVEAIVQDVHQMTSFLKSRFPGLPVTLFGHSMGSLVVRCYAQEFDYDIDALVVCGSPSKRLGTGLAIATTKFLQLFHGDRHRSNLVNSLAFGGYNKKFADAISPNSWIVSDPAVVEAYDADERDGFVFTLNGFETLFKLVRRAYSKKGWGVQNPELPILFIAGEDDPCIITPRDFDKAVQFLRDRGYKNVSSKLYPGMRHEILNEIGKKAVWRDVVAHTWLAEHRV